MNATILSIISISIIFLATILGSSFVFFFKKAFGPKINDAVLGFAGGIMIAASFFGLILPSINEAKSIEAYSGWSYIPPLVGFAIGGLILWGMDKLIPHTHLTNGEDEGVGRKKTPKNLKFFLAVTIHNIPEGLSVGFACGLALSSSNNSLALGYAALSLAIGIAIQNIPEGAAVSIPMLGTGESKGRSFLFGSLSGAVEPIAAIIGLFLARLSFITPWLLSLAAGAMVYVTLDEIMPEARKAEGSHIGIWSFMIGFLIMMALEMTL